jgi:hypothetical protein
MTPRKFFFNKSAGLASTIVLSLGLCIGAASAQSNVTLSAHVAEDGRLVVGSGVTSVRRVEAGKYIVTFKREVRSCVPVVSGGPFRAFVFTFQDPNGVFIMIDSPGALRDSEFYLIVAC